MIYLVMVACVLLGAGVALMIWGRPPRHSVLIHPSPELEAEIVAKRRNRAMIVGAGFGLLLGIAAAWADGRYGDGNLLFRRNRPLQTEPPGEHAGDVWVEPYTKVDGAKVQGHWRSRADGDASNNWSEKGNVNPHTGKPGDKTD